MSTAKTLSSRRRHDMDMTQGNVVRQLLTFAFPLLLGNLFQQLYNMVDTWVVGNYVSNEAFAAVGTVTPITAMMVNFFSGLAGGASVVTSQYYGARRYDKVQESVHTFVCATLILCLIFTCAGTLLTPIMLDWMGTDPSVLPESTTYLNIYFYGISGLLLYNMGSGILRSVGDSRRPFYFLVVCALTNIVLDLLFVLQFNMGVKGVALATIISQFISAFLVLRVLLLTDSCVQLFPSRIRIHGDLLRKIIRVGLPSALQMSITSFSNIFVQSYIYQFGADCMSGWAAYSKIDQLIILPMTSLSISTSTFVGQNLGNRNPDRAEQGVRTSQVMIFISTVSLSLFAAVFAPSLVAFFNDKPEVVEYGALFLRLMCSFFFLCGATTIYGAGLRGAGNSRPMMIIMLSSYVVYRQIYLFIVSNYISNTLIPIVIGYPSGWLLATVMSHIYYKKVGIRKSKILEEAHSAG